MDILNTVSLESNSQIKINFDGGDLSSLFTDIVSMVSANITEMLKSKVNNWMASQPLFIQALFGDLCWES